MTAPTRIAAVLAGALALSAFTGWQGYRAGRAACEAAHNATLLAHIEAGRKLDDDRRRLARERDELAAQLEEEAHADPVIVERCLAPGRVQRLNTLR